MRTSLLLVLVLASCSKSKTDPAAGSGSGSMTEPGSGGSMTPGSGSATAPADAAEPATGSGSAGSATGSGSAATGSAAAGSGSGSGATADLGIKLDVDAPDAWKAKIAQVAALHLGMLPAAVRANQFALAVKLVTADEKTGSCNVSMTLSTAPKAEMFGTLTGGAKVEVKSAADGKAAIEDCISAVVEDLIMKKVGPTLDKKIAK